MMRGFLMASLVLVLSATTMPARAQTATPDQAAAKFAADRDAFGAFHGQLPLGDAAGDYLAAARRWMPPGTTAANGPRFVFNLFPFDEAERLFVAATVLPGSVPALDGPASRMADALKALDPLIRDMRHYADAHGWEDDDYAHARQVQPAILAAVRETLAADKALETALSEYAITVERQEVAAAKPGLPRDMLADRLAVREVASLVRALPAGGDVAPAREAMARMAAAHRVFVAGLDGLSPPAAKDCAAYAHSADLVLGGAREEIRRAQAGDDPRQPIDEVGDNYPRAMEAFDRCQAAEARVRP